MRWFIIIVLFVYLIPNIVVFIKCIRLIKNRMARLAVSLFFLILAGAFPIGEIWYNNTQEGFSKFYLLVGYYYLPVLLYSFLLLIAFQLIIFFVSVLKKTSRFFFKGRSFQVAAMSVILLASIITVILGHANFNNTRITDYQIEIPAKSSRLSNLKIAMASDLHIYELTSKRFIDQFVVKINSLHPDIVLLPGDILEGVSETSDMPYFEEKLNSIQSKYGVYASPGNHEHYGGSFEEAGFFKNAGIVMLNDTAIVIDHGFYLAGFAGREYDDLRITHLSSSVVNDTLPVILLNHYPENFGLARLINADIQLSGHTHHGQLWPLNMITTAIYDISWGYKKINNTHVFVTSGAQGWGPPVRTGSYSEIMDIKINFTGTTGNQ